MKKLFKTSLKRVAPVKVIGEVLDARQIDEEMDLALKGLSFEDLQVLTSNFSEENFIGKILFGKVYRGKIEQGWKGMQAQDVTVKVWEDLVITRDDQLIYRASRSDNISRFNDEIIFLKDGPLKDQPNLVKLMGCCCDDQHLGVVYNLKSLNTLHNLVVEGSFSWFHRVKVALGFARLIECFHTQEPKYSIRGIAASHIMLGEDFNPVLFHFPMLSGGVVGDKSDIRNIFESVGCFGYLDISIALHGQLTERMDVYAFGVVLLGLISKKQVFGDCMLRHESEGSLYHDSFSFWTKYEHAEGREFEDFSHLLVHKSLCEDPDFVPEDGRKIAMLALRCVQLSGKWRPPIGQVIKELQDFRVSSRKAPKMQCFVPWVFI